MTPPRPADARCERHVRWSNDGNIKDPAAAAFEQDPDDVRAEHQDVDELDQPAVEFSPIVQVVGP